MFYISWVRFCTEIIESQSCWGWLWRLSDSTHLLKQRHLEQVVQDDVQTLWKISKNEDFTTWATCTTALSPSHSKSVSLCLDVTSCFLNLCSLPLVLEAACPELVSVFFTTSLQIFMHIGGFPSEPSFHSEQPTPFSLSSYKTGSSPLIILMTLCWPLSSNSTSLWLWEDQNSVFPYTFSASILAEAPCSST